MLATYDGASMQRYLRMWLIRFLHSQLFEIALEPRPGTFIHFDEDFNGFVHDPSVQACHTSCPDNVSAHQRPLTVTVAAVWCSAC